MPTRQIQIVRREIEIPLQLNLCPVGEVFHNLAIKCFFFFFFFVSGLDELLHMRPACTAGR